MTQIGVLALQGDFAAHQRAFHGLGIDAHEVRRVKELEHLNGLVIPGGESSTLLKLMENEPWFDSIRRFHGRGGAIFGTCAGAILLAREVHSPTQASLGLIDAVVERNAFGRQIDSFETALQLEGGENETVWAIFIRAPRFRSIGPGVEILASLKQDQGPEPVLVRQGRVMAATFHPELTPDGRIHQWFVDTVQRKHNGTSRKPHSGPTLRPASR